MSHTARVAAVVGPAGVLLGWLALSGGLGPPQATELLPPGPDIEALLRELQSDPEVVLVGNSQAVAGVDPELLADALGEEVATAAFGAARPYLLYRVLKGRVFSREHSPRLVLAVISPQQLIDLRPPPDHHESRFAAELNQPMPEVDGPVHGRFADGPVARAIRSSRQLRQRTLDTLTQLPASLSGAHDPALRMEQAVDAVMNTGELGNMARAHRVIPVVEPAEQQGQRSGGGSLDDSLVPQFIELAAAHDARLVVVTLPQRIPSLRMSTHEQSQLEDWLYEHGAGLVDLEDFPTSPADWFDEGHLSEAARDRFTRAVAEGLTDVAALGPVPLKRRLRLLPTEITRTGDLPAAPVATKISVQGPCLIRLTVPGTRSVSNVVTTSHGYGFASPLRVSLRGVPLQALPPEDDPTCRGSYHHVQNTVLVQLPRAGEPALSDLELSWTDAVPSLQRWHNSPAAEPTAWLVPPGSTVSWTSRQADLPAYVGARLYLTRLTDGSPPTATLNDERIALSSLGEVIYGLAEAATAQQQLTVRLANPAAGSWLMVDALGLSFDGRTSWWVGGTDAIPLQVPIVAGRVTQVQTEPAEVAAPIPVDVVGNRYQVTLPSHEDAVTAGALAERLGEDFRGCSPLRLRSGSEQRYVRFLEPGATEFSFPPADGPHAFVLAADRRCRVNHWLYPGDTLVARTRGSAGLHAPGQRLSLYGQVFGRAARVRVEVLVDGKAHASTAVRWLGADERVEVLLDPPVPPTPRNLVVRLSIGADAPYVLIRQAHLRAELPVSPPDPSDLFVFPYGDKKPEVQTQGDALHITPKPEAIALVCLPMALAPQREIRVVVSSADAPGGARHVLAGLRYLDAEGREIREVQPGEGELPWVGNRRVGPEAVPLVARATTPAGATSVSACVRLPPGQGSVVVRGLRGAASAKP